MVDQAGGGVEGVEVGQVVLAEVGQGVAGQVAGVVGADGEEDFVAGVGGDAFAQLAGQLGEVLVREGERQA